MNADELMEQIVGAVGQLSLEREEELAGEAKKICAYRKEAIDYRKSREIEDQWDEDEEAYEGLDEFSKRDDGRVSRADFIGYAGADNGRKGVHSTAVLNITRLYVDSAAARVADMILPTGDLPFKLDPTPRSDSSYFGTMDAASEMGIVERRESSERTERTIKDWLVECNWHGQALKVIRSAALYGTGVMKGPLPTERRFGSEELGLLRDMLSPSEKLRVLYRPGSEFVSVRNLYPDSSCGNNIQDGTYLFEKKEISERNLRKLKMDSSYFCDQICKCLEEGPKKVGEEQSRLRRKDDNRKRIYTLWLYWGPISKKLIQMVSEGEAVLGDEEEDEGGEGEEEEGVMGNKGEGEETEFAHAILCNSRLIKVAKNTLNVDEFPFDVLCWQEQEDYWAGIGVARHARVPQRGLTATLRNLLDNSSLTSGPQIVIWKGVLEPKDGSWEIYPRKVWEANVENNLEGIRQVQNAIMSIDIPGHIPELMDVIRFFLDMAEKSTGISMVFQGMSSGEGRQSLGGMQMQTNMASSILRTLARSIDGLIKAHINRYYEWVKLYGPEDAIGDLQVEVQGSGALIERDLHAQALMNLLPLSLNSAYGISPQRAMEMLVKAWRFEYGLLQMSDEEKRNIQPETPVQIEVEKLREESAAQIAQMELAIEKYKVDVKAAVEQMRLGAKGQIEGLKISAKDKESQGATGMGKTEDGRSPESPESPEKNDSLISPDQANILAQLGLA